MWRLFASGGRMIRAFCHGPNCLPWQNAGSSATSDPMDIQIIDFVPQETSPGRAP